MKTLSVNSNNDIHISNGSIVMSDGLRALAYTAEQNVKTLLGELVFDTTAGVDYFGVAWNGKPNVTQLENYIRTQILNTDGVTNIQSLTVFAQSDNFSYTAVIETIYGEAKLGV